MRLDILLTKKGFVDSREKAKYLIKNGYIVKGLTDSELKGKSSNQQEFFIYLIER